LLLGLVSQLFDHELFDASVDLSFFLVLEIKSLSSNEFFGRFLDEVGWDEGLNQGHCLLMWMVVEEGKGYCAFFCCSTYLVGGGWWMDWIICEK
jgi:hypothetical protein